ncbi:MAG: DUF502 domain-containing protein [Candidatus Krumholzibacteria bacterium]|jgi:uncharacterized membrane protein|nr:DUF502 domain-containing protein [Candidatus Krumholzibacteria bacterium]MDP6669792.1 DUF502 domain-containing protein [Candidatus Krumholzibacteria bacterium]MDP6796514.1 DUF502 domain-containing protein [Candidatus Krumholzibacteria bacterium]MDP7021921.1 DUF502 domain-containing protein [Candidatus Krumholzibacteria bacterium]
MRSLKRSFFAGLIVLAPTVVTVWFLWKSFVVVDGFLDPVIRQLLGFQIPGLGFLTVIALLTITGFFAGSFLGRQLTGLWKGLVSRLPFAGKLFDAVDRLLAVFQQKNSFRGVVCFEYPRQGIWSLGFVTSPALERIHGQYWEEDGEDRHGNSHKAGDPVKMHHVFLPTSPNPTSGVFLMVPIHEVVYPKLSVEEALNMIVSGGAILPQSLPQSPAGKD